MAAFDPGQMLETIARDAVTSVLLAPTMIQMGLDWREQNPQRAADLDLSSLGLIRYGASPMTPALLARSRAAFPNAQFAQGYGMTELAPVATLLGPEFHNEAGQASGKMHSVGRPAPMVEVKIVDPQGREVPRAARWGRSPCAAPT